MVIVISGGKTFSPKFECPSIFRLTMRTVVTIVIIINTNINAVRICFFEKMLRKTPIATDNGIAPILTLATESAVADDKMIFESAALAAG